MLVLTQAHAQKSSPQIHNLMFYKEYLLSSKNSQASAVYESVHGIRLCRRGLVGRSVLVGVLLNSVLIIIALHEKNNHWLLGAHAALHQAHVLL